MRAWVLSSRVAPLLEPALHAYKAHARAAAQAVAANAAIVGDEANDGGGSTGGSTGGGLVAGLCGSAVLAGRYYGHLATVRAFADFLGWAHAAAAARRPSAAAAAPGEALAQAVRATWAALVPGALLPAEADLGQLGYTGRQ
jgi:hypothetical protein